MKKSLILLLAALSLFPLISAAQIEMKSNFTQGETLIAAVSGNFLEQIQEQNILLYEGHNRVSFIPTVGQMQDEYYIYGQLAGKSPGNYSLIIRGISYFESGQTKTDDIISNFTITDNQTDFTVTPGFLQTIGNFSINAENFKDTSITVSSFIKNSTQAPQNPGFFGFLTGSSSTSNEIETQIPAGKSEAISFSADNYSNQLIYAVLDSGNTHYEIPVFISGNATSGENESQLSFNPPERKVSMVANSSTFIYIYLDNSGQTDLSDIFLNVSNSLAPYVFISNNSFSLDKNSSIQIRANISSGTKDGIFIGNISASSGNLTSYFFLSLNFSKAYTPSGNTSLFQTCSELGGQFCNSNETCSTPFQNAEDGKCCTGTCKPVSSNSGAIVGWILAIVILLLVIAFFVWRFMKAKRPFNLLSIAKGK
ncbi:MAG TPA: hypothetical protein VMC07_02945 [Candidatus Omnitrophota bacterium]|nr:hypothetical protein [Candidatus Omnitrophota bacterium]